MIKLKHKTKTNKSSKMYMIKIFSVLNIQLAKLVFVGKSYVKF